MNPPADSSTVELLPRPRRGRTVILAVAGVCLLPLLAAVYFRFISPPENLRLTGEPLPAQALELARLPRVAAGADIADAPVQQLLSDHWLILHVDAASCAAPCQAALHLSRQARIAQYKNVARVQRVWLARDGVPAPAVVAEHPDLLVLDASQAPELSALRADSLYLVDRRGFLVFRYDAGVVPRSFIRDLERLVKF